MEKSAYRLLFDLEDKYWWHRGLHLIARNLLDLDGNFAGRKAKILDAGCGTGGWLKELKHDFWVSGLDLSNDALYYCRNRGLDRLVKGDVANLPYKDKSFDIVTAFDVIYHKDILSDLDVLKEFARVLKSHGSLFLNCPAYEFMRSYHDKVTHARERYTASGLKHKLKGAGFKIIRLSYWNTFLFPLAFLRKMIRGDLTEKGASLPQFPEKVNNLMFKTLQLEAAILKRVNLPYGLSICCLAERD